MDKNKCKESLWRAIRKYQKTTKGKAAQKRYRQSEKGKAAYIKGKKKYQKTTKGKVAQERFLALNPKYIKATDAVNKAIKSGIMLKPLFYKCKYCPAQAQQYHHYKGYELENWLKVEPVCRKCHYKCDRRIA